MKNNIKNGIKDSIKDDRVRTNNNNRAKENLEEKKTFGNLI